MKKLYTLLLAIGICSGQTISLSPQGKTALKALTGKVITGVQVVAYVSDGCGPMTGASIYTLASRGGYSYILPSAGAAIVSVTVENNGKKRLVYWIGEASILAAIIASGDLVAVSKPGIAALTLLHSGADRLQSRLQEQIPNPAPLLTKIVDPDAVIAPTSGYIFAQFNYKNMPTTKTFPCEAPKPGLAPGIGIKLTPDSGTPGTSVWPSITLTNTSSLVSPTFTYFVDMGRLSEEIYRKG